MKEVDFYAVFHGIDPDVSIVAYGDAKDGENTILRKFKITFRDGFHYLFCKSSHMYYFTGYKSKNFARCKQYASAFYNEDYKVMEMLKIHNESDITILNYQQTAN